MALTRKQQMFVLEYLKDLNATQAAIRAGYSPTTANARAPTWIGKNREKSRYPEIWDAVQAAMQERSERVRIDADYVLGTIRDTVERCKQAEPVVDKDGNETGEYRFDAIAVLRGSELLGRHLELFTDKIKHEHRFTFRTEK